MQRRSFADPRILDFVATFDDSQQRLAGNGAVVPEDTNSLHVDNRRAGIDLRRSDGLDIPARTCTETATSACGGIEGVSPQVETTRVGSGCLSGALTQPFF
jgi:hypothetical protein